ncbi:signal peptidase I [Streptomyces sp. NPDC088354]|uniref:signal peptidase I n=1 Tax=unclassified Streptomyces TaxID=2593676 RepID=UPI0029A4D542|nr:signal peptidase I [Streptomyces sp. MI02-7b]MDX3072996.1 signal peptidase I [Streptomyces sp. MI02-7b]
MGSRGRSGEDRPVRAAYLGDEAEAAGPRRSGGRAERRRLARKVKRKRRRSAAREIPLLIGVALLIALVLKTFLLQAFVIPSGSMEQTIRIGDRVVVDKFTPWFGAKPHRGDVVVFKDPGNWLEGEQASGGQDPVGVRQVKEFFTFIGLLPSADEQDLIKRVVAVGGDTVKCCDKDGRVTVNGTPLDEPYIYPGNPPSDIKFTVKVPPGRLFVMGDHRSNSADSRFHLKDPGDGTVPESLVVGRAFAVAWPLGHWSGLKEPTTFSTVAAPALSGASAATASHRVATSNNRQGMIALPPPAELPLVMGVVGLRRIWRRGRQRGVRSGCGGPGGRRKVRTRGAGGPWVLGGRDRRGRGEARRRRARGLRLGRLGRLLRRGG